MRLFTLVGLLPLQVPPTAELTYRNPYIPPSLSSRISGYMFEEKFALL
jgi:hypothetical protein